MPEEELKNTALLQRIEELEQRIRELEVSRDIPESIEKAFQDRGFLNVGEFGFPDPNNDFISNVGFRRDISLTGNAQTITVPAFPARFTRIKDKNLYMPAYSYAEFGF